MWAKAQARCVSTRYLERSVALDAESDRQLQVEGRSCELSRRLGQRSSAGEHVERLRIEKARARALHDRRGNDVPGTIDREPDDGIALLTPGPCFGWVTTLLAELLHDFF